MCILYEILEKLVFLLNNILNNVVFLWGEAVFRQMSNNVYLILQCLNNVN